MKIKGKDKMKVKKVRRYKRLGHGGIKKERKRMSVQREEWKDPSASLMDK